MMTGRIIAGVMTLTMLLNGVAAAVDKPPARPRFTMTEEEHQALIKAHKAEIAEARRRQAERKQAQAAELKRIFEETTPAEEKALAAMSLEKVRTEQAQAKIWLDQYPVEARKLALAVDDAKQRVAAEDPKIAPIQRQIDALQSQLYDLQAQRNALVEKHPSVQAAVRAVTALQARQRDLAVWEQKVGLRVIALEHEAAEAAERAATAESGAGNE